MILGGKIHLLGKYVNTLLKGCLKEFKGGKLFAPIHPRKIDPEFQEPFPIFRLSIIKFFASFARLDTARPSLKPAEPLELPIVHILYSVVMLASLPAEMRSQGSLWFQEDRRFIRQRPRSSRSSPSHKKNEHIRSFFGMVC
jgi:hypothetical protein